MGFGREGFERAANLDNESAGDVGETLRRLVGYLLPHRYALSMSMVSMVLSAVALAVSPFIVAYTIDNYILTGDVNGLIRMLLVLLGAFAMQYLGFRGQFYYVGIMGQEVMARIRSEIFVKVQKLSLSYFDKHDAGDLMSRLVNDVDVLNQFLSQGFVQFIGGIVRMIFVAVAMFLVDWRLALATLIVVPMMILVSTYLSRLARKAFRESRESLGDVSTELEEGISGVKVAQAFNRSEENVRHFQELNRRNRDANVGAVGVSSAFMPAMEVLNALATTIVAGYGGYQAISGAISVGVVVGFLEYVRRFFFPVQQIAQLWVLVQSSLAGAERIFHLLDEEVSLTDAPGAQPMPEIQGRIVFDNVEFEYDKGEPILRGISLTAEPGQTVAVVGPTGAGKTTVINLLSRFYDVTAGRVLIDGIDVRDVTQDSLRRQIGVVLQDNFLFSGTVADNIRYGRLDATDEEVEIAARTVGAHGFISGLAQGYQTELGERGGNLSQGQRQLISFARAILANPRVLVLDEATASVDTRTELVIQEALKKLLAGRTSFVIAHRLSTIRDADQVLVMEQGKIVERGTHDELVARGGAYAQLHARQFRDVSTIALNGSGVNGKVREKVEE
ncbi:MAG: ABC transporter ATP-binding protein [Caldilineaceae bacterium]|nr:ABC transporter ATP-binding protein [Caldilineaceae bacterium]MCB9150966.1 ABC transporter ATP-binding protein [Caldilineaceae bacterium]